MKPEQDEGEDDRDDQRDELARGVPGSESPQMPHVEGHVGYCEKQGTDQRGADQMWVKGNQGAYQDHDELECRRSQVADEVIVVRGERGDPGVARERESGEERLRPDQGPYGGNSFGHGQDKKTNAQPRSAGHEMLQSVVTRGAWQSRAG
jgi:hypothetical protein